jgi:hypothetical protein
MSMPLKSSFLLLGLFLSSTLLGQSPIEEYNSSKTYPTGDLVLVGQDSYKAIADVPANTVPPNATYWINLAAEAVNQTTPSEAVPSSPPTESPPGSEPPLDGNSSLKIVRVNIRGTVAPDKQVGGATVPGARIVSFKLAFDDGSTTSTSDVMVRGIGSGLKGTEGGTNYAQDYTPLANPKLYVNRFADDLSGSSVPVTDNSDWGTQRAENKASSLLPTEAAKMSIPIDLNVLDAAAIYPFIYGFYTFPVQSQSGSSGVAWVGADKINLNDGSRFTHCSCRGDVGTGGDIMILSFEIVGDSTATKKVLVRGRGPSLEHLGVTSGYLNDASLEVFKFDSNWVAQPLVGQNSTNDNWTTNNDATIDQVAKSLDFNVGLDNLDPAVFLQLGPGYYTAKLKGNGNTTGIGWVAVDEVP